MRLIAASITNRTVYVGQQITYLGSIRASVKGVYQNGRKVRCAYFSSKTKPIFRSESARFIIYVQMSREMWDFDPNESGNIVFDRVVNGVLPELFRRWSTIGARHLVSVVFFTRIEHTARSHHEPSEDTLAPFQDFFRVVIAESSSGDWTQIIRRLKADFQKFLSEILTFEGHESEAENYLTDSETPSSGKTHHTAAIEGRPTTAMDGNILEAINTVSSSFSRDFFDTDLVRTGLSVLLITPGSGIFNVDEGLLRLTTENLVNNGINIDLLCLTRPPCHAAPLFRYISNVHGNAATDVKSIVEAAGKEKQPIYASTPPSAQVTDAGPISSSTRVPMAKVNDSSALRGKISVMPHWVHVHFWHHSLPSKSENYSLAHTRGQHTIGNRHCSMSDVQSNGIMESETCQICIPLLLDSSRNLEVMLEQIQLSLTAKHPQEEDRLHQDRKQHQPFDPTSAAGSNTVRDELDEHDRNSFSRSCSQQKRGQELSRRSSFRRLPQHQIHDSNGKTQRSGASIFANSPNSSSNLTMLYKRHRAQAGLSDLPTSKLDPIIKDRPAILARKASTTSSNLSGVFDRRSFLPTSRGLSIGKASASISQPSTQSNDKTSTPASSAERMQSDDEQNLVKSQAHRPESIKSSRSALSQTSHTTLAPFSKPTSILLATNEADSSQKPHLPEVLGPRRPEVASLESRDGHSNLASTTQQPSPSPGQAQFEHMRYPADVPVYVARWLTVTNPAKPRNLQVVDHGWANAFTHPRQALDLGMKWKSLCAPASLPLTSDHIIRRNMLPHYEERTHRVSMDDEENRGPVNSAGTHLLGQLMAYRLAKGFQIVKGSSEDDFCPFDDKMLEDEGRQIFLMKGNTVHVLLATDNDIEISMYQPKTAVTDVGASEIYRPMIKSTLEPTYDRVAIPLTLARDEHNWSIIDNCIAGHLEYFSGATGFWRARFSLVPVEPMRQSRKDDDSDDELRIEGILRLSQIWHKATVSDGDLTTAGAGQKNPLSIEFQTRDLSAVLSAGLEDSQLLQGQSVVRSTQLINSETDQHRSDKIDLKRLAHDLQGPQGIAVKDRRWYLKLHRRAFIGLDLTAWLEKNFDDVVNRDQAEELGDKLMEMGLFKHVRSTHRFRDGNYFYQFMPDYQVAKAKVGSSQTPSPRTASADTPSKSVRNVSASSIQEAEAGKSNLAAANAPSKPHIFLTAKLQIDIDTRKKSDRAERVSLHYDRVCNPEACYHFRLEWMSTTEKLIEEAISSWATTSERYGWKLVQAPITEACKIAKANPFRTPTVIVFAIAPPEQEPDLSHVDSTAPEPLPTHRYHPYQRALLKRFGFVMDVEAAINHPADIDLRYSYANEGYSYSQYIHKSGTLMAQVDINGRLLLVANRLANNRSSFARDAAARMEKREHDRVTSGNMPSRSSTSTLGSPHLLGSPRSHGLAQHPERTSPHPFVPQTAEQVKESLQTFCADKDALLRFYEEVSRRDPLLSPASTPAVGPRQAPSTRSTPMLQATIPTLELPMSGIGQLLSLSNAPTPASGPATPDAYLTKRERSQS